MTSRNVSVHTMSIYVIHRTDYANSAVHIDIFIIMTNKSAITSNYVNKTYIYLLSVLPGVPVTTPVFAE